MATSKIYAAPETSVTFKDSGGDAVITLQNLAFGVGRISAQIDRGAGSKPVEYRWKGVFQFETAAIVGEWVEIYIVESDGTYVDGNAGAVDAAFVVAQAPNVKLIGIVKVPTTDTATNFISSGMCTINSRYYSVAVINRSAGDNLENTANASVVILTPMPMESQ